MCLNVLVCSPRSQLGAELAGPASSVDFKCSAGPAGPILYCGKPTFNCGLMLAGLPGMSAELAWLSRALASDTARCKSRQKNQTQFGKYAVIKVCKLCRNWVDVNAGYRKVIRASLSILCSGTTLQVVCRLSRAVCMLTTVVRSQGSQGSSFIMGSLH